MEKKIFELHAEVCKMLAQPLRLEILYHLGEKELSVRELTEKTGARLANISQHLALMRQRGIVTARKEGVKVYYSVANKKTLEAFELMREVLLDRLKASKGLAESMSEMLNTKVSIWRMTKLQQLYSTMFLMVRRSRITP